MEKKFFFKIIGIIVAVVTAMAGIVIWIDPFYHYHKPLSYISYVSGADVYSNDGKLKHFDYDTLTIGTSMAMNFRKEKVDTILGGNSLNVYYLGEGFKVINEGLETALDTSGFKAGGSDSRYDMVCVGCKLGRKRVLSGISI